MELVEVSIYRYLFLSLVASCGCVACLLLLRASCRSCGISYLLLSLLGPLAVSSAVGCITSLLLSVVYRGRSCLLLWSCYLIARSDHRLAPWVPSGGPIPDPQEGGGDFSKRGERLTETRPVPIFMREVKKNVVFQRKTGKIQLETVVFQRKTGENGENLR